MIFVTVGNWHKGFDRLIKAVDELIEQGVIREEVVMQIGSGSYQPRNAEWFEYASPEQCEEHIRQSRIVISHAGMGTIATAIGYAKPVIVVPRKHSLKEHYDDHQFSTARQLELEKAVLVAYETDALITKLDEAKSFVPTKRECSDKLFQVIREYLKDLQQKK